MLRQMVLAVFAMAAMGLGLSGAAHAETMRFQVAEDGNRFAYDESRVYDDGMPAHGSGFVTQGYIYPDGTLSGTNGVLADGSPEFPDKVIGEWICYGYMIGEAGHATTGAWVVSTQIYQFNGDYEGATVITNGFEIADVKVPVSRAVTGGTGSFTGAVGEQTQALLGFTEQMGVNLSVELDVQVN